jgi:hypothetical protein
MCHCAECRYAECRKLCIVMLNVVMLNVDIGDANNWFGFAGMLLGTLTTLIKFTTLQRTLTLPQQ